MKVYISGYRDHWISPYTMLDYMFWWTDWSKCSRDKTVIRSLAEEREHKYVERPEWVEWCKMLDPECPKKGMEIFWFNRYTKETRYAQPLQSSIWEGRMARATCVSGKTSSWVEYWDSRTKTPFFYNAFTKQYACSGDRQKER